MRVARVGKSAAGACLVPVGGEQAGKRHPDNTYISHYLRSVRRLEAVSKRKSRARARARARECVPFGRVADAVAGGCERNEALARGKWQEKPSFVSFSFLLFHVPPTRHDTYDTVGHDRTEQTGNNKVLAGSCLGYILFYTLTEYGDDVTI